MIEPRDPELDAFVALLRSATPPPEQLAIARAGVLAGAAAPASAGSSAGSIVLKLCLVGLVLLSGGAGAPGAAASGKTALAALAPVVAPAPVPHVEAPPEVEAPTPVVVAPTPPVEVARPAPPALDATQEVTLDVPLDLTVVPTAPTGPSAPSATMAAVHEALSDAELTRHLEQVRSIEQEQRRLARDARLLEGDVATRVSADLTVARFLAAAAAAEGVQRRLRRYRNGLRELASRMDTVELELTTERRRELDYPNRTPVERAEGGPFVGLAGGQLWPFTGEFWPDELPYYRQAIRNRCGR